MSYFSDNYNQISYPVSTEHENGLRNAQIGAIHSIAAHFTLYDKEPGLVVMPTGSGKTAVLIMSAFLERATRVLVISSSVLVRGQIQEEFQSLQTLKKAKVLDEKIALPKVIEVESPITSKEMWEKFRDYDVVIGIPNSLSSGITELISPPQDLFDLVLVDEAHHTAADTWKKVIKAFVTSKKIFFTATPFRRDKKEVEGKIIYNYPLSKARKDKIFGEIGFHPVTPLVGETNDSAIAKATERVLNEDRANDLDHYLLVRTNTKKHAQELEKIYKKTTKLNLRRIDSRKTYKYIKATIKKLKAKELDGIICVDMLGEGFDFPNLKIAAIHAPHKSLAVTLQFIGRFARTNANNIGTAKFIAAPNDIEIGRKQLYAEEAIWNELIVDLSQERIMQEDVVKTTLDTFDRKDDEDSEEQEDISLYNLNPYCHVKIYRIRDFNIEGQISIPGHEIIHHYLSQEHSTVIFITKESLKPKWINSDEIIDINYYLFIVFFDIETGLLFLHSAFKTSQFYDVLVSQFAHDEKPEKISKYDIHKVLAGLRDTEIFNLGMQNRSANNGESYRTIAGSNAPNMVKKSDGRMYSNGHIFGKAVNEFDKNITIGYSSGSKVWSNAYEKIPAFINWCKILSQKIDSDIEVKTNSGLDNLPIGKRINSFPSPVYAAVWDKDTFTNTPILNVISEDGEIIEIFQLLDFDIIINKEESNENILSIDITNDYLKIPITFTFENHFQLREEFIPKIAIDGFSLVEYLNEYPLQFHLTDFSSVIHGELHKSSGGEIHFDNGQITVIDWIATNTDIQIEFYDLNNPKIKLKVNNDNKNSIHETLDLQLSKENFDVVIYDHGTGEMADFITFKEEDDQIKINLIHIKGSGGQEAGDRVNDTYEVCGQSVKSLLWTTSKKGFNKKILNRIKDKPEKFKVGSIEQYKTIIEKHKLINYTITIVQPGISKQDLSEKLSTILAAADNYISSNGNNEKLNVWASN